MRTGLAIVAAAALLVGCSGPSDSPTPNVHATATTEPTVPAAVTTTPVVTTTPARPASPPPSPNATPSSTPTIDAAGLAQADGASASQLATYTAVYDELGTHCSNPLYIAFTLSTAVSVLNGEGAKTSNLRFMQGLIQMLGSSRGVDCSSAILDYQIRVYESLSGQPTPQTPLPITHAPAGPSLPPSGCTGLTWPQPIPKDLIGASAKQAMTDALVCFTVAATAPDGHDIGTDRANDLTPWVITSVRPASGTLVGESDVITIHVALKAG